jgi:methyl-accepting chemotaxis protein
MEELIKSNPETLHFLLKKLPWSLLGAWLLYTLAVLLFKPIRKSLSNFYIVESIPNVFVTLGLFGTFTGIGYGLLYFETSPDLIKGSITTLLDGLRGAMFTSIAGIILSLIFSNIIKVGVNSNRISPPESPELIELQNLNKNFLDFKDAILTTQHEALVEALKDVLGDFNTVFSGFINELIEQNFKELSATINQLTEWQKQHKEDVSNLTTAYRELVGNHTVFVNKTNEWVEKLDEISGQSSKLQHIIDEFNEAFNEDGNLSRVMREIQHSTSELKESSTSFSEIASKMNDTSSSIKVTGDKISEWTGSVQSVSENSQKIVEKVEVLQTINTSHIDDLVEQFNTRLKGTFGTFDALIQEYMKSIENRINKN